MPRLVGALTIVLALMGGLLAPQAAGARARGDVQVLAPVPAPGYPALPHLYGGYIWEGTYDNPYGSSSPSRVFQYTLSGQIVQAWTVAGQNVSGPHGVQIGANTAAGDLLLLDKTSGRIIRMNPWTGRQSLYSRVPDLPVCSAAPAGAPCSPARVDQAPMPDYAAWGPDGSLYVPDYQQAVIWRIPPGGGTPAVWLADPRLDGGPFGTACILMLPDHRTLLFDQASNGGVGGPNPTTGKLFRVQIQSSGRPGPIQQLWESGPAEAPDGCTVARSGHIYLAMVGFTSQIVELSSTGQEITRFGQAYTGANNSSVPFDSPSGLAYLGTDLIIANQSYFADNPSNQVLLSLETGEPGLPLYVPPGAGENAAPKHPAGPRHRSRPKHRTAPKHKRKPRHRRRPAGPPDPDDH